MICRPTERWHYVTDSLENREFYLFVTVFSGVLYASRFMHPSACAASMKI
jgi:hypothetical protein